MSIRDRELVGGHRLTHERRAWNRARSRQRLRGGADSLRADIQHSRQMRGSVHGKVIGNMLEYLKSLAGGGGGKGGEKQAGAMKETLFEKHNPQRTAKQKARKTKLAIRKAGKKEGNLGDMGLVKLLEGMTVSGAGGRDSVVDGAGGAGGAGIWYEGVFEANPQMIAYYDDLVDFANSECFEATNRIQDIINKVEVHEEDVIPDRMGGMFNLGRGGKMSLRTHQMLNIISMKKQKWYPSSAVQRITNELNALLGVHHVPIETIPETFVREHLGKPTSPMPIPRSVTQYVTNLPDSVREQVWCLMVCREALILLIHTREAVERTHPILRKIYKILVEVEGDATKAHLKQADPMFHEAIVRNQNMRLEDPHLGSEE